MNQLVKPLTWILGIVLTLVGVAGFFVNGMLLFFEVSPLHNVIHILSGAAALVAVNTQDAEQYSVLYLKVFGAVYALVTVLGFVMGGDILGLIHVNMADNYLHLAIAAVSLVVGFGAQAGAPMGGSTAGGMPRY